VVFFYIVPAEKIPLVKSSALPRLVSLLITLSAAAGSSVGAAPTTPNIVVILSDDYGYGSLGAYGADSALVRTPNLDRLAREGRRFTDAYTPSSVCTPTRYALITGRYCWRTALNHGGVANTLDPLLIETTRPTIASLLKKHGYATGFIGKWHLGYLLRRAAPCRGLHTLTFSPSASTRSF
jgi:arylsulfatase A